MYFSMHYAIKGPHMTLLYKTTLTMRINTKRKVRNVAGENIVIRQLEGAVDMTQVAALNESAMLLYNELKDKDFTLEDIVQTLLAHYDTDEATARRDAEEWVAAMRKQDLVTD